MPNLEEVAKASTTLSHVQALIDVLGEGKQLTDKGNLKLADGRELARRIGREREFDTPEGFKTFTTREVPSVDLTFWWAKAARFIRVEKNAARPTKRGKSLGRLPLEDVWSFYEAFIDKLRWLEHRYTIRGAPYYARDLWGSLPDLMIRATLERTLELPSVAGDFARWAFETYDFDDATQGELDWFPLIVAYEIWQTVFCPLGELGIFELTGYSPPMVGDRTPDEERSGSLTLLGKWAVMRYLGRSGSNSTADP